MDNLLLDIGNFMSRNFYPQIASGHHNAITDLNDFVQILQSFRTFYFRNNFHCRAMLIQNGTDLANGIRCPYEGSGDKIKAFLNSKTNIFFIFVCKSRQLNLDIRNIYAFLGSQLPAIDNRTNDICAFYLYYFQFNQSVVN